MGYGGGSHQGGYLTDSIIVAKVDPRQKQITLTSTPRDLWVPIPINGDEVKYSKINAAYAIGVDDKKYPNKKAEFTGKAGGGELSKSVISKIVGSNIDYFVTLDFQGFIKTVDILGGISVPVKNTLDDPYYPLETNIDDTCGKTEDEIKSLEATMSGDKLDQQFTCRYEHLHFDPGLQNMDGQTALKFVRSRHSKEDGGDFNRAARQQLVISSVKDKVLKLNFIPKIIPFINTLSSNMTTDIDFSKMQEFANQSSELSQYKIKSLALTDQNVLVQSKSTDGQFILIPKEGMDQWNQVQQFINDAGVSTSSAKQK
jgi:LCP family protein required for cell wall assembly